MAISTISSAGLAAGAVGTSQLATSPTITTPTIAQINSASSGTPTIFADSAGNQVGTICRAWVMWTTFSSTVAIQSSFNVSSVTRISSGQYTITLTTAMPDNKFVAVSSGNSGSITALGQTPSWGDRQASSIPVTSSTISYINGQTNSSTGMNDAAVNSCAVFR